MISIRHGTFETNSSSAHALITTKKDVFNIFKEGEMVLRLGGFGVPKSYLVGRGWSEPDGPTGKLLSWASVRDLYVEYLKSERARCHRRQYINLLNWNVRKGIRKPDDITVEDFRKAVEYGEKSQNGCSPLVMGNWFNFKELFKPRLVESELEESKATEKDDKVELDFWWFAG